MKIAVIGTGYVGLVAGTAFASKGNQVVCVDKNESIVETLKKGVPTIHEENLASHLKKAVLENKTLTFTTDISKAINESDIVFIAVGTPPGKDGKADLTYVREVASKIGQKMTHPLIVVDKSTVPVGTAFMVRDIIKNEQEKRDVNIKFHVASNPEFLAEGRAVRDMFEPSRIVVGADDKEVLKILKRLYSSFTLRNDRFFGMRVVDAEVTKYAANYLLAVRVSAINAVADVCEAFGADVSNVRSAVAADPRIGDKFLYPSCGYGGSCFPKDVQALVSQAKEAGVPPEVIQILEAPEILNNFQKNKIAQRIIGRFGENLSGKKIAIWGLAFKKDTDDMRESAAINLIKTLLELGAEVVAYDPLARKQAEKVYLKGLKVIYVDNMYDALAEADALAVMTETDEYLSPDFEKMLKEMKNPIIFDGRNLYDPELMDSLNIEYFGIGRGLSIKKAV